MARISGVSAPGRQDAYARQDGDDDGLPGKGEGFVSVFDTDGNFLNRLVNGSLRAPWGVALAPRNKARNLPSVSRADPAKR